MVRFNSHIVLLCKQQFIIWKHRSGSTPCAVLVLLWKQQLIRHPKAHCHSLYPCTRIWKSFCKHCVTCTYSWNLRYCHKAGGPFLLINTTSNIPCTAPQGDTYNHSTPTMLSTQQESTSSCFEISMHHPLCLWAPSRTPHIMWVFCTRQRRPLKAGPLPVRGPLRPPLLAVEDYESTCQDGHPLRPGHWCPHSSPTVSTTWIREPQHKVNSHKKYCSISATLFLKLPSTIEPPWM